MARGWRLLQLLSPGEMLMYGTALALGQQGVRRGGQALIVGPFLRPQQEQIRARGLEWVNCPLLPYEQAGGGPGERRQLARLVRDFRPDIIHVYGLPALRAAAGLGPLVCTLSDLVRYRLSRWERWQLKRWLGKCQRVIVSSESDLAALRQLSGRLAAQARLIPPAAELRAITADFDVGRKRRSLGLRAETAAVGVISPAVADLGLETVLEVAAAVTRDFPNVEFLIVGEGPDRERLMLAAHERGISGAVVFRGDRSDIPEIIASLNALLIPREVAGSVSYALQAVALDVPVVAVRTPALAAVLEPVDPAALAPGEDAAALAALLSERLEILPPPEDDAAGNLGGLTASDMLVSSLGFDLDRLGLEPQWRGDESERQLTIRRLQERFGPQEVVRQIYALYEEIGAKRPACQAEA